MFSRPVSSGWKPVPTSSRLPTRPRRSRPRPSVGSVMREQDLEQRALAGAVAADDARRPRRGSTSNETSFSAQNCSRGARANGCRIRRISASATVAGLSAWTVSMNDLPTSRARIATSLDDIGEPPFGPLCETRRHPRRTPERCTRRSTRGRAAAAEARRSATSGMPRSRSPSG